MRLATVRSYTRQQTLLSGKIAPPPDAACVPSCSASFCCDLMALRALASRHLASFDAAAAAAAATRVSPDSKTASGLVAASESPPTF